VIFPKYLQKGDRIRIVAPAGKVQKDKILPGIDLLVEEGFEVIVGKHVFGKHFQFSGTDQQRAFDLQEAINDERTKAIICARGGYGCVRLIEMINFEPLLKNPKWLVGFSDITVIHIILNKIGIASIHGAMPGFFIENKKPGRSFFSLIDALISGKSSFDVAADPFNRRGTGLGELIGGNLSLLYSLQGTPWQLDTTGKILILEDVSEYLYHLDRMIMNLRIAGQFRHLAGLVVGGFTELKDNESPFGKTAAEIIVDAVRDYRYPVCFDFPIGHLPRNLSFISGGTYRLEVADRCTLKHMEP
jgi:muramoyltetrapeptide carboxypeptidase